MNFITIGLNHRTAPVEVRERMAFPRAALGEATCLLLGATPLYEAAILSTCNRVEIYGLTGDLVRASAAMRRFLHEHHKLTENVESHLYEFRDRECIQHLLEVACGLDSMVVGETEILGQVKEAYLAAQQAGATGMALNRLFQKAFAGAKHIRTTTAITRGSTSVGSVAVDLAEKIFRDLGSRTVMVLGTGEMSEATAKALRNRGAGSIIVCSRTQERAETLANQLGGRAISYSQWPTEFPGVDIVISSTAAPHPIVTAEKLTPLMKLRRQRPLFLIDIAVPRDIERACGELENVYLYDIDDLQQIAQQNIAAREREIVACRALIAEHEARFWGWFEQNRERLSSSANPHSDPPHEPHNAEPTPAPSQEGNSGVRLPSSGGVGGGFMGSIRDRKAVGPLPCATREREISSPPPGGEDQEPVLSPPKDEGAGGYRFSHRSS
ncbi:MAG: glutamyl-tRNA reductase [Verrucomicrobiia bacterium]